MMALIHSLVIPTIWGNCARCMFKFDSWSFFPCNSEILLKIRTKDYMPSIVIPINVRIIGRSLVSIKIVTSIFNTQYTTNITYISQLRCRSVINNKLKYSRLTGLQKSKDTIVRGVAIMRCVWIISTLS